MLGAGFIKDMINTSRSNRSILKGKGLGKYQNFDPSQYPSPLTRGNAPIYKQASAEHLEEIRARMIAENNRTRRIKLRILISSFLVALILLLLLFYVKV